MYEGVCSLFYYFKEEIILCQIRKRYSFLHSAARCAILIIEKGKPQKRPTLETIKLNVFYISRQLFPVVGGYFFPLKIV